MERHPDLAVKRIEHLTEIDVTVKANPRDLTNGASFSSMVAADGVEGTSGSSSTLFEVAGKRGGNFGGPMTDPSTARSSIGSGGCCAGGRNGVEERDWTPRRW